VNKDVSGRAALGSVIRDLRENDPRSLSQERFAEVADIDRSHYASIERGERNLNFELLWMIVSALGISWQEFGRALDEHPALRRRPPDREQRRRL
jgi:transcriptional regulator with XRE-family HTH domain